MRLFKAVLLLQLLVIVQVLVGQVGYWLVIAAREQSLYDKLMFEYIRLKNNSRIENQHSRIEMEMFSHLYAVTRYICNFTCFMVYSLYPFLYYSQANNVTTHTQSQMRNL